MPATRSPALPVRKQRARLVRLLIFLRAVGPWMIAGGHHREAIRRPPTNQEVYTRASACAFVGSDLPQIRLLLAVKRRGIEFRERAFVLPMPPLQSRAIAFVGPRASHLSWVSQPKRSELARAQRDWID